MPRRARPSGIGRLNAPGPRRGKAMANDDTVAIGIVRRMLSRFPAFERLAWMASSFDLSFSAVADLVQVALVEADEELQTA